MAVNTKGKQNFLEVLMEKVEEVYDMESKKIVEKHKIEIDRELEFLRNEVVTRASMTIGERLSIDDFGQKITITILKDER